MNEWKEAGKKEKKDDEWMHGRNKEGKMEGKGGRMNGRNIGGKEED